MFCWQRGIAVGIIYLMNKVTVHRAQLVFGWATIYRRVTSRLSGDLKTCFYKKIPSPVGFIGFLWDISM